QLVCFLFKSWPACHADGRTDVRYSSPVCSATYLEKPDSKESGFFSLYVLEIKIYKKLSCSSVGLLFV
ncbi:hypothetical protein, partial [Photobacterium damselae]|uniref:hypothetical protein n=1 Tax=Photobacterium damselae TaxID=38293 RepID=UPI001C40B351